MFLPIERTSLPFGQIREFAEDVLFVLLMNPLKQTNASYLLIAEAVVFAETITCFMTITIAKRVVYFQL